MLLRQASQEDTRLQVRLAYNQVYGQLTPEQQAEFTFDKVFNHVHQVVRQQRTLTLVSDLPDNYLETAVSTECETAIIVASVDTVMLVLQIIGITATAARPAATEVVGLLSEKTLSTFQVLIKQLGHGSNKDKAIVAYKIFAGIVRATGLKKLYFIIQKSMHWYDWALMAVIIITQIILWVTSDGVAAAVEIALVIANAVELALSVAKAIEVCIAAPPPPAQDGDLGFALAPGAALLVGQKLVSLNEAFFAILQSDSNFVIYNSHGVPEWSSETYTDPKELVFEENGELILYATNGVQAWSTGTVFTGENICMLSNYGNLILSDGSNVMWSEPGHDPGTTKGAPVLLGDNVTLTAANKTFVIPQIELSALAPVNLAYYPRLGSSSSDPAPTRQTLRLTATTKTGDGTPILYQSILGISTTNSSVGAYKWLSRYYEAADCFYYSSPNALPTASQWKVVPVTEQSGPLLYGQAVKLLNMDYNEYLAVDPSNAQFITTSAEGDLWAFQKA